MKIGRGRRIFRIGRKIRIEWMRSRRRQMD